MVEQQIQSDTEGQSADSVQYRHISADSHLDFPPEMWTHRVDAKYRDRAPRRITLPNGYSAVLSEGNSIKYGGTNLYGGSSPEDFSPAVLDYEHSAGTGGPEQRLKEQDADGIDAEVLYTLGVRNTKIRDTKAMVAIVQGFNDFLAEEFCSVAPKRLLGVAVLPDAGVDGDIAEMQRCSEMGLKAVQLSTFPSGKALPTPEDDRFWAAAVEMQMPISIHTSFPMVVGTTDISLFNYPKQARGEDAVPVDYLQRIARHGIHHCGSLEAVQLMLAGVFDRFPDLQIYWAENNIGWIPYFYEQMDAAYSRNHHWAERLLGLQPLKELPSHYLREHAYWGFWDDEYGLQNRDLIGVERIMWSTDFPHVVTYWPHSLEVMEKQMAGIPDEEKQKIVAGNAIKFFHLDR